MKINCRILLLLALLLRFNMESSALVFSNFTYEVVNSEVIITDYPDEATGAVVIPAEIDTYPVTAIGDSAFEGCYDIISILFSDSIITVGDYAFFECEGLTQISFGANVQQLGESAFDGCIAVNQLEIPASMTQIDYYAFGYCLGLTTIDVAPSNTTYKSVDGVLFDFAEETLIQYPIGNPRLTYLIPAGTLTLGESAFDSGEVLENVVLADSLLYIEPYAFWASESLTEISFGTNVLSIGSNAFDYCTALQSLSFPEGLATIGRSAFYHCDSLTNVTFGTGLNSIGAAAFAYCTTLTTITLPAGLNEISDELFSNCTNLETVFISEGITNLGKKAFFQCTTLQSMELPDSIRSIGDFAFHNCFELNPLDLGSELVNLGESAFENCTDLTRLVIPAGVSSIGPDFALGCINLTEIFYLGVPQASGNAFHNAPTTIYYFGDLATLTDPWMGRPTLDMGSHTVAKTWLLDYGYAFDTDLSTDPNGDGVTLLAAYALDLDPTTDLSGSLPAGEVNSASNTFSISYYAAAPGITYTVETTAALEQDSWTTNGVSHSGLDTNSIRTSSMDLNPTNGFLRLEVEN